MLVAWMSLAAISGHRLSTASDGVRDGVRDGVLIYEDATGRVARSGHRPYRGDVICVDLRSGHGWMVRLVDVQPDGRTLLLADEALRARSRDPDRAGRFNAARLSTIKPGKIYRYTVRFWRGTANLFQVGHRIRVEISSSWFPFFLPNLNTGADNLASVSLSEAVVAHQSIHHGPNHSSYIVLPVIPPRAAVEEPSGALESYRQ